MLIREGAERSPETDLRLAAVLAAVAGALNAAAFQAVGFFSANMTGNVSALSDHMALGQGRVAGFFLAIVATFIAGAAISTLLVNAGRRHAMVGIYAFSILLEAVLMAALGLADARLAAPWRGSVLVLGLAFLMGLQNATVTRISDARVRTTHVSGMATDIGIELAMLIDIARGRVDDVPAPWRARVRLHLVTVLSFLGGGVAGVMTYRAMGGALLEITSAVLFVVAANGLRRAWRLARP